MFNLSLRTKIFFAMALIGLLMASAIVFVDFRQRRRDLLTEFQGSLRGIAGTAALALRGEDVDKIHTNADASGEEFRRSRAVLQRVQEINRLGERDVHIIRPISADLKCNEFVVMLHPQPYVGDPYEVPEGDRAALLEAWHGTPASTGIYKDRFGTFISGFAPVLAANGKPTAIIEVDKDIDEFFDQARHELWMKICVSAVVLLIAMIPGLLLANYITRGLNKLSDGLRKFRAGDLAVQVKLRDRLGGEDEVIRLAEAFNEMIVSLGEKLAMLPYVSRLTAEAVRKSRSNPAWLTGSEREIVVLFADLRGFTSFSEHRAAREVVDDLNRLLAAAADAVLSAGGDVDKFVGDCIMAVFIDDMHAQHAGGAAAPTGGVALATGAQAKALQSAEAMIRHVNREASAHGWSLAMGVGIHCGPAVVGSIGSEARRDFTAIGHTVNLASRLCSKAHGGEVLVTEAFRAALAPEQQGSFVKTEPLMLKNVSQGVTTYAWTVEAPGAAVVGG